MLSAERIKGHPPNIPSPTFGTSSTESFDEA
jgi:hypothetical protein